MVKIIPTLLFCSLAATNVYADSEPANYGSNGRQEETSGFLGGLALGALAGGPPGAIVGGAIGALFGEGWHAKKEVGALQFSLVQNQVQLKQLKEESARVQQLYLLAQAELDTLKNPAPQAMNVAHSLSVLSSCCNDTSLSLHFRSGSNSIETHYEEQLEGIAKLAKSTPSTRVEIIGYADRNGDAQQNLSLSKQRTDTVKNYFNSIGVSNSSITTMAYGETKPLTEAQSFESDFFDRRVIVRLRDSNNQFLTQSRENP